MNLHFWEKGLEKKFFGNGISPVHLFVADGQVLYDVYQEVKRANPSSVKNDSVSDRESAAQDFFRAVITEVFLHRDIDRSLVFGDEFKISEVADWIIDDLNGNFLLSMCVFFAAIWTYQRDEEAGGNDADYRQERFIGALSWGVQKTDFKDRRFKPDPSPQSFSDGIVRLFEALKKKHANLYMPPGDYKYRISRADGITITHAIFRYAEVENVYRAFAEYRLLKNGRYDRNVFQRIACEIPYDRYPVDLDTRVDAVEKLFEAWPGVELETSTGKQQKKDTSEEIGKTPGGQSGWRVANPAKGLFPILLGLQPTRTGYKKSILVEIPADGEISSDFSIATIHGKSVKTVPMTDCLYVDEPPEKIDEIWHELATSLESHDEDSFAFSYRQFYIFMRHGVSRFKQNEDFVENVPFYVLYTKKDEQKVDDWINKHGISNCDPEEVDAEWRLRLISKGIMANVWKDLVGDKNTQCGSTIRLVDGLKANREEYLPDFLPDVEAYLPRECTPSLSVIPDDDEKSGKIEIREIGAEEENLDQNDGFRWRSFEIFTTSPGIQKIEVSFDLGGGKSCRKAIKVFHSDGVLADAASGYILDKYGELVEKVDGVDGLQVCPCEDKILSSKIGEYPVKPVADDKLDYWEDYWAFVTSFRMVRRGPRGVLARDFWRLFRKSFYGKPHWRTRIHQLFSLGILDIYTEPGGLWAGFQPNAVALCLSPFEWDGKRMVFLTGCFKREDVDKLAGVAMQKGCEVKITRQMLYDEDCNESPFILPPRVAIFCPRLDVVQKLSEETGIPFKGVMAADYVGRGADLDDWKKVIQQFANPGDGSNAPTPVTGWFNMFDYVMGAVDDSDLPSTPLEVSDFFSPCLRSRFRDFDSSHRTYEFIYKQENKTILVKDRAWARWATYDLSQKGEGFSGKKFKIAYDQQKGAIVLPEGMAFPKIFSRAATLCTGFAPLRSRTCTPYDRMVDEGGESEYGLSMKPYKNEAGCLIYIGVPQEIASTIAQKLHAELKQFSFAE